MNQNLLLALIFLAGIVALSLVPGLRSGLASILRSEKVKRELLKTFIRIGAILSAFGLQLYILFGNVQIDGYYADLGLIVILEAIILYQVYMMEIETHQNRSRAAIRVVTIAVVFLIIVLPIYAATQRLGL